MVEVVQLFIKLYGHIELSKCCELWLGTVGKDMHFMDGCSSMVWHWYVM